MKTTITDSFHVKIILNLLMLTTGGLLLTANAGLPCEVASGWYLMRLAGKSSCSVEPIIPAAAGITPTPGFGRGRTGRKKSRLPVRPSSACTAWSTTAFGRSPCFSVACLTAGQLIGTRGPGTVLIGLRKPRHCVLRNESVTRWRLIPSGNGPFFLVVNLVSAVHYLPTPGYGTAPIGNRAT